MVDAHRLNDSITMAAPPAPILPYLYNTGNTINIPVNIWIFDIHERKFASTANHNICVYIKINQTSSYTGVTIT